MLKVALTGGIGSGKTTATDYFESLGISIIDADRISHHLTSRGSVGFDFILSELGPSILLPDGELNRKLVRSVLFNNISFKQKLERFMHPLIFKIIADQVSITSGLYTIISIPLLTQEYKFSFIDRILLIECSIENQIKRTMLRDKISYDSVMQIIDHQPSANEKIALADDIIANNHSAQELHFKIDQLHKFYIRLSQSDS